MHNLPQNPTRSPGLDVHASMNAVVKENQTWYRERTSAKPPISKRTVQMSSDSTSRVAVIGAGPAGSAAAMSLLRHSGIDVVMLERYALPRQKACGSGLSPWTLKLLDNMGVGELVREKAHPIAGAKIAGSNGEPIELRGDHETAIFLREEFDYLLAQEAESRGADLRDEVYVSDIVRSGGEDGPVEGIETRDGSIEVDAVVDCSGANGTFSRAERPGRTLHTIMGWWKGLEDQSDVVEVYFDTSVKPHYGWVFPETDDRVNIGICYDPGNDGPNVKERFEQFIDRRLDGRLDAADQQGRLTGHPVSTSWYAKKLVKHSTLACGEAGQLADMATAEGIYHALLSGWEAGGVLGPLLQRGEEPTAEALKPYTRRVRKKLGMRLAGGRALMESLRTPAMDMLLQFRNFKPARELLTRTFAGLYHG